MKVGTFHIDVDEAWMRRARCRTLGKSPEFFFPERGEYAVPIRTVCAPCPVRAECLEYALTNRIAFGHWGGVSERERKRMLQQRGRR